jgi:hypothetical protein
MKQKSLSIFLVFVDSIVCIIPALAQASPKYVFLFIGDGMGMPQRAAADWSLDLYQENFCARA